MRAIGCGTRHEIVGIVDRPRGLEDGSAHVTRIRGSSTTYMMSANRFIKITADARRHEPRQQNGASPVPSALRNPWPIPEIEKICSVMITPPNEERSVERGDGHERDQRVAERVLPDTRRRGTPLARAVRT